MQQTREQFEAELAKAATLLEEEKVFSVVLKGETGDHWKLTFTIVTEMSNHDLGGPLCLEKSKMWTAEGLFEAVTFLARRWRD
jgi:hypothetical protein